MDVLRIILNSIQLLTFIIAFIYCKNLKKGIYLRSYFLFIIFSEIIGKLLEVCSLFEFNKLWYNFIVIPAEFFFWYWYMLQQFKEKKEILFVKSGIIILTLSFVFEWLFFYDTKTVFISLSYTLGNLILLVFILMYFKNLTHSKRILTFDKELAFWFCCGLLLFYLGTFPLFGLYNYFILHYPKELRVYYIVMLVLNSLMYLLFSFGMVWTKPK